MRNRKSNYFRILPLFALLLALGGCASSPRLTGTGRPASNANDNDNSGSNLPPPADDAVVIRFVNESTVVVDTQFHITSDPTATSADALFVADHLVTEGIGVAGTGLLVPLSADTLEWPCDDGLILGVAGGRFLDRDTGAELGTGPARLIQQGLVFDCGARIDFTYQETEDGFTVVVSHE